MAETLTVALRVAEEAIEEAIANAEEFGDSLVRRLDFSPLDSFLSPNRKCHHYQKAAVFFGPESLASG